MRRAIFWTMLAVLAAAGLAFASSEKEGTHFTVVSANYRDAEDGGVVTIVVKNEGDLAGAATVTLTRERTRCAEHDPDYCAEHPAPAGESCTPPCLKYETTVLGTATAATRSVASCEEAAVEIRVPAEAAYAEITVSPGGGLAYGLEIAPGR